MTEPDLISLAPLPLPSMRFEQLLADGVRFSQELAGDLWTDYNEHDPGVTILEQLAYAITDLGYRVNYTIPDLLAAAPGEAGNARNYSTLYSGDTVLSCQPLTVNDYRRRLYDKQHHVRNIWFEPAPQRQHDAVPGLYRILVDVYDDGRDPEARAVYCEEQCAQVKKEFMACRNLGEDVLEVKALALQQVTLSGLLQVADQSDPLEVLAQVLFAVQCKLRPVPTFDAVEKLMQEKQSPDTIFEGPLLQHGVLPDSELQPRASQIGVGDLKQVVQGVAGVETVVRLAFHNCPEQERDAHDGPKLDTDHVFTLDVSEAGPYWPALELNWRGVVCKPDRVQVSRRVQQLWEDIHFREHYAQQHEAALAYRTPAPGRYRAPARYESIQHQFPLTYGIGAYGVPEQPWLDHGERGADPYASREPLARTARQAQARQLKAYLLFFEQILANHAAQLGNFGKLFSSDPELENTYFSQPLAHRQALAGDPPDLRPLLKGARAAPLMPETLLYRPQITARRGRLLLRGEEAGSVRLAESRREAILEHGQREDGYRLKPVGKDQVRVTLYGGDELLAFADRSYRSDAAAQRAVRHMAAWLRRLARDSGARTRHVTLRVRGVQKLELRDEHNAVLLSVPNLRRAELAAAGEELLTAGQQPARYVLPPHGRGTLTLRLGAHESPRDAVGHERLHRHEQAQAARARLIAWTGKLACDAALRKRYLVSDGAPPTPPEEDWLAGYQDGLEKLVRRYDRVWERRHAFLDHLLARFDERFDDANLLRFDPRPESEKEGFWRDLAHWKGLFLFHWAPTQGTYAPPDGAQRFIERLDLGGRRSAGGDYRTPDNRSGFEQRLRFLLGIGGCQSPLPTDSIYVGEDMTLIEHVLLRPSAATPLQQAEASLDLHRRHDAAAQDKLPDFLAYRLSLVFPASPLRFQTKGWPEFVQRIAAEQCPAHLAVHCHWLADDPMTEFQTLHGAWRTALAQGAGDLDAKAEALRRFLQDLDQGGSASP